MEASGARLKKIRQELGISLEEVQKKTKIHLNILKAIEGDSLTDLNPIYLKGFLKIYCQFLGLNPKDYISDYKEAKAAQVVKLTKDISAKPIRLNTFLNSAKVRLRSLGPINKKVKTALVFIAIIIVLSLGLFNLGKFISSKRRPHARETRKEQKIQKSPSAAVTPRANTAKSIRKAKIETPKQTTSNTLPEKKMASGIRLGIRARENCWISLKVDGRLVFQRVLEKGRFESWQAKDRIEFSLSNAAAVELEVNGQLFSSLGRKGQLLKNIVISKEGLNITR